MTVSRGRSRQPRSLASTPSAAAAVMPAGPPGGRYSRVTAAAYRCGGDTAATNSATGGGASAPCSTARASSYAMIAPRHAPNSAYGLSCAPQLPSS